MYTPVNPSFTVEKWGLRGSKLYRYVFVIPVHKIHETPHKQRIFSGALKCHMSSVPKQLVLTFQQEDLNEVQPKQSHQVIMWRLYILTF